MQGLGNDYVYVNCFEEQIDHPEELAVQISNRHLGVGSDGLILICPSQVADFEMRMYNADGSRGEMCGNGIRCVGKYVYDYGLTGMDHISVETLGGIKQLDLVIEDHKVVQVKVDMGAPILKADLIPIRVEKNLDCPGSNAREYILSTKKIDATEDHEDVHWSIEIANVKQAKSLKNNVGVDTIIDAPIDVNGSTYRITGVSMGNPHAVIFMDQIDHLDLEKIGPLFEHHERFPNRINTEFVQVIDRQTVKMRVWERGSGETQACGTGACAVAVACILNGLTNDEVTVQLLGGDLLIQWDRERDTVFMTGPAEVVFEGKWQLEADKLENSEESYK